MNIVQWMLYFVILHSSIVNCSVKTNYSTTLIRWWDGVRTKRAQHGNVLRSIPATLWPKKMGHEGTVRSTPSDRAQSEPFVLGFGAVRAWPVASIFLFRPLFSASCSSSSCVSEVCWPVSLGIAHLQRTVAEIVLWSSFAWRLIGFRLRSWRRPRSVEVSMPTKLLVVKNVGPESWWSTTTSSPMGTSRRTGRTMWGPGSTSPHARREEERVWSCISV